MANARRIQIEFLGDSRDLSNAANDGIRSTSKLGDTLKKAGKVAAIGLAAGAVVAGKALFDMTKGAIEDAAAQTKLATALKNNAGATKGQISAVEDWISAQGTALGVTDDELRPALEKLVVATKDVGEAQKLASLGMDIAAGTGQSLESVTKALAKAQNGSIAGLSKLGISTKNAAGETVSFAEAQKRLGAAFEGQAAKKANTRQGKMARLKLILSEAGETIGAKLIPVVTKMADWFLRVGLPAIQRFGGYLQQTLPPIFERIRAVIATVMGSVKGDVGGNLTAVTDIVRDAVSIIRSLWDRFGSTIMEYARNTFNNLRLIISGAFQVIRGIFQTVSSLLRGDWKGAWEGIKTILSGAWKVIQGIVRQALNIVKSLMKIGWKLIQGVVSGAWDGIKTLTRNAITKVVAFVKGIPGKLKDALSNLKSTLRDLFDAAMGAGLEKVKNIGGTIKDWITGIPAKLLELKDKFKNAGKDLIGAVVDGMKNAAGIISGIAGNVWDAVRGLLNSAIDKINAALEFKISLPGPDVHVNLPDIPHLARGTNYHRGGVALVGEEGPELVDLPRGARVTPNKEAVGALRGVGGGGNVFITINALDPKAASRAVISAIRQAERQTGLPLLVTPR